MRNFQIILLMVSSLNFLSAQTISNHQVRYTQNSLEISDNAGINWISLAIFSSINPSTYICSVDRHPLDPNRILIGTSFQGIYETTNLGKTWQNISKNKVFTPISQGSGFINEISQVMYQNDSSGDFLIKEGFGGKSWLFNRKENKLSAYLTDWPSARSLKIPSSLTLPVAEKNNDFESRASRKKLASSRKAIYLNPSVAVGKSLDKQLNFVINNGMNSIIVDFKDDYGKLTYQSKVPLAIETLASKPRIDVQDLIHKAHTKGIYVIARIVVFKDQNLYQYNKNELALWDKVRKQPWGVFREGQQIEYWVDPFADKVHQFNIAIATEATNLGVDEIQFDYIRFPSDGYPQNIQARFHTKSTIEAYDRVIALSNFLAKARSAISIPISTDVYGFNGWARMSYLGQDIQAFANYVDAISPMAYPSHYDMSFLNTMRFFDRAEYIQAESARRGAIIVEDKCLIRPYVQAFLIGNERDFSYAQAYEYLNRQIIGLQIGKGNGFALWNNSGDYYMVQTSTFKNLVGGIQ